MKRAVIIAVLATGWMPCTTAHADVPKPLPADLVWYECTGYGVRIANNTMSETTPETEPQLAIYAVSVSAKRMWWYWEPEHQLRDYTTTEITDDRITVTQRHDMSPRYIVDGTFSLDRRQMTYTSNGAAAYPDGTQQIVRGTGTCRTIAPRPVG